MVKVEGGEGCYLYPCGSAAIANAILAFLKSGDHLLVSEVVYDPTQDFCNQILRDFGVATDYFSPLICDDTNK